jgi:hypothetical protein
MAKLSNAAQKIRSFPTKKSLSGSNLREFRSYVSQLKKQGVIPKSVDARSARPYFKRGGKTLAEIVNRNHAKLTPHPTLSPGVTPAKTKLADGPLAIRDFATNQKGLATLFRDMEKDDALAARVDAMKRDDEMWGFRIEGTDSMHIFADIRLLIDEAFKYGKRIGPYGTEDIFHKRSKSVDLLDKLVLVRWNKGPSAWDAQRRAKGKRIMRGRKRK